MDLNRKAFFTILSLLIFLKLYGLDLTRVNLSYQYDIGAALKVDYRLVKLGRSLTVFYEVTADSLGLWNLDYLLQESYASETHDTLRIKPDTLFLGPEKGMFKMELQPGQNELFLLVFSNMEAGVYWIFDIPVIADSAVPSFYPVDDQGLPYLGKFLTTSEVRFNTGNSIYAFRYPDNFDPADPPMGQMKPLAPTLYIDSSFVFRKELTGLEEYHFYLFQLDTLDESGITLLSCPPYYPEFRKLEELIGPLTYITTSVENKSLKESEDPKKTFETFWLNTYGTKFRAKNAIRNFYNQIEEANLLFTDYKQGWKTDRGIIYIVYGLPDQVFRSDRTEVWRYGDIEFEFIRISTLFTPVLYSLKRDRRYEKLWYSRIGNIRKGR